MSFQFYLKRCGEGCAQMKKPFVIPRQKLLKYDKNHSCIATLEVSLHYENLPIFNRCSLTSQTGASGGRVRGELRLHQ